MSIMSWLSPALTATTNTVSAIQGAQEDATKAKTAQALQQIQLLRQQHEQELKDLLTQATTKKTLRDAGTLRLGDADYAPAEGAVAAAKGAATIPSDVARVEALAAPKATAAAQEIQATAQPKADAGALAARALIQPGVEKITAETPALAREAGAKELAQVPGKVAAAQGTSEYAPPVAAVDPVTGQTTFHTRSEALGLNKPSTGAGGGNQPQMTAAKANIDSAIHTMDTFEEKLKHGQAKYNPFDATKGAAGSSEQTQTAKGLLGPAESFVGNVAGASLRGDNPELAEYLKAKKFVAEAILNTHKRPNQTQYEIEQELSGIGPMFGNWQSPAVAHQIAQSKERRDRMLHDVFGGVGTAPAVAPATPQRRATDTPGNVDLRQPTAEQALYDAAVKLHGAKKVLDEYGARPDDEE